MKFSGVLLVMGSAALGAACCGIGAGGAAVRFVGQSNIVIWDAAKGIEHFVRDARFDTKGKDLGFIAPTPSEPKLSDVDPAAFDTLSALKPQPVTLFAAKSADDEATAAAGSVSVVSEQDVAGYHAAVLKATDPASLSGWLSKNGYPAPKFLDAWTKPYIEKGWYFTAFKVKGGSESATGPVRMSFATKRPFNPYSVPEENGGGGASLQVFYVSAGSEVPLIGGKDAWKQANWSASVPVGSAKLLATQLKLPTEAIPENATVSNFTDDDFGQPGFDDLYFVPDMGRLYVNAGVGAAVLLVAYVAVRRRRKVPAAV